jgi:hypothetical protein
MDSMDANGMVTFEVLAEDEGGYSASADVGTWGLVTQGDDLDELNRMILELIGIYNEREERKITAYSLMFASALPVAA